MKPLSLIILLAIALCAFMPYEHSDRTKVGLHGNVKSVENWSDGNRLEAFRKKSFYGHDSSKSLVIYGADGMIMEAIYLDNDSMQIQRDDYQYDINGKLDRIIFDAASHSDFPAKAEFRYNKDGNLREVDRYRSELNTPVASFWYDYDDRENLTTIYKQGTGGKYTEITENKYDDMGRIAQIDVENGNSVLLNRTVNRYDNAGHLMETLHFNGQDTEGFARKEVFTYNEDGKKTEEWDYTVRSDNRKETSELDSTRKTWNYYYNYNVVEESVREYPGSGVKWTRDSVAYRYDSVGNWIRQSHYYSNHDSAILIRRITYY